jgi:hypothetical protein
MPRILAGLLLSSLSWSVASAEVADPASYVVTQAVSLPSGWQVELLHDVRFVGAIRELWAGADPGYRCQEPSPEFAALCASLAEQPASAPWIRLVDSRGEMLDRREFERELASVEPIGTFGAGQPMLGVTVDLGVGFGSYAGLSTRFVVVRDDRFEWVTVANPAAGRPVELVLSRTLKADWRAVPRSDGRGQDLLAVRCLPKLGQSATEFEVLFERYRFEGNEWHREERREPGFWESEDEFPAVTRFPGES